MQYNYYRAAWNASADYEKGVCLSLRLSACQMRDKTEEGSVQIYIPYERSFSLVFWEEEWLVGDPYLSPEILGKGDPVGAKSPIFSPHSLVALQR